jgi:hypothetical protein
MKRTSLSFGTIIRLVLATLTAGAIGIGIAIYFSNLIGYLSLLIGFVIGIVGTEIHYVPRLAEKWERTGIPGEPKTQEQQEIWEKERNKEQRKRNLFILVGLIVAALLKQMFPDGEEFLNIFLPIVFGGFAGYVFRYGLLIYDKRGKLGR